MLTHRKEKGVVEKKKFPPLPDVVVLDIVKRCCTTTGTGFVTWTQHFKQRMDKRRIIISDVLNAFDMARISKRPEWNEEFGEYNYFITGKDLEGIELTIKIAIAERDEMITLITLY
jgi:hypothetical protein